MSGFLRRGISTFRAGSSVLTAGIQISPSISSHTQIRRILTRSSPTREFSHPCYSDLPAGFDPYAIVIGFPISTITQIKKLMDEKKYNPIVPPVCFIGDKDTQSWIAHIHEDHRHRDWGQHLSAFPKEIQKRLLLIRPTLKDKTQVAWGDMQDLYHLMVLEVKQAGFSIVEKTVTQMSEQGVIKTKQDDSHQPINPHWIVYNFAQAHRQPTIGGGHTSIPHTELYKQSIESIRAIGEKGFSVCTVGNGLSFTWLQHHLGEHFNGTVCLKLPGVTTPIPPSICHVDYRNTSMLSLDAASVTELEPNLYQIQGPCTASGKDIVILSRELYATAGFSPCTELTKHVPNHRKIVSDSLRTNATLAANHPTTPQGSLPEITVRLKERGGETPLISNIYTDSMLIKLTEKIEQVGIVLPENYLSALKTTIATIPTQNTSGNEYLFKIHMDALDQSQKDSANESASSPNNRERYETFLREELNLPRHSGKKPRL
jgi:hypothetical protein